MITCPWCETTYETFRPNCGNCGGTLPPPDRAGVSSEKALSAPPPAPRRAPRHHLWRLLFADGWGLAGGILTLIGVIFFLVGGGLSLGAAILSRPELEEPFSTTGLALGLPFVGIGLLLLAIGLPVLAGRYRRALQSLNVFRLGETATGTIVDVRQNHRVSVNGRHPWIITYSFRAAGREHEGQRMTLNEAGSRLQPGQPVYVLYLLDQPEQNTLYLPWEAE